jgi:tetratricopeptide (TPR) repeat protein
VDMKTRIQSLIQTAVEEQRCLYDRLTEEERTRVGTAETWPAKDVIAHSASWTNQMVHNLQGISQGRGPCAPEDLDRVNVEIYEKHRDQSWEEVLAYAESALEALSEWVDRLEGDFDKVGLFPFLPEWPLWRMLVWYGYTHSVRHLVDYSRAQGDEERVAELNESMAAELGGLVDHPDWQGLIRYNLACHYSLAGQKSEALAALREALTLNPGLVAWSGQDPDFEPIRADPAYALIHEGLGGDPSS